jgi:hypothetical protein
MAGEPQKRLEGMAQNLPPLPAVDLGSVQLDHALDRRQIRPFRHERSQDGARIPGIVRDQGENVEVPVIRVAVLDQFQGGADAGNPLPDLPDVPREAPPAHVPPQADTDLELDPEMNVLGQRCGQARRMDPGVEDHPSDGMPDAAHLLHARGREADLISRGRGPLARQQLSYVQVLDVIGRTDGGDLGGPRHRGERNPVVMLLEEPFGQCVETVHGIVL